MCRKFCVIRGAAICTWSASASFGVKPNSHRADYCKAGLNGSCSWKRRRQDNDLLSELVRMADAGRGLDRDEALATAFSLFGAGFDTTRHLIGNAVHALLCQPDQLVRLRREPSLVRAAVEEFLRYDGSVQFTTRTALKDFSLDGEQF